MMMKMEPKTAACFTTWILTVAFCRLIVEARLPGIKSIIAFQTMMRVVGKDAPKDLKAKLEVSLCVVNITDWLIICS